MPFFVHLPNADWRNDGWSLVGTAVTRLWEALSNDDDTKYIRTPASKGQATIRFPVDVSDVPEGAVITSVTVKLRCGTGTGSAPSGTSPSVTIAVSADDDTSRFLTRTIYPTSTIQTFEVASYRVDPLGLRWDVHRLNHILCRVFSYVAIFDLIRCYKFFCEVNYRVRPTITVDAPTGTVVTPSPEIAWTYTQADGDPQKSAEYRLFTSVQQAAVSFNPDKTPPLFTGTVEGDLSTVTLPTSLNPESYWVYVRSTSTYGAKSVWVGKQFTITGTSPGQPGVPDPDPDNPGAAIIQVVPDRFAGMAQLTMRDTSNMLSAQTADAEEASEGAPVTAANCTITRSTADAYPGGTASWRLSSSGTSTMSLLSEWVEINQVSDLTAVAQFKTASSARSCRVQVLFYDGQFAQVSGTLTGSTITDSTATWTEATVTGTPPNDAVYAKVSVDVLSPGGASEIHYVDHVGLMNGVDTPYSDGGHGSRNLLSSWYSDAEGTAGSGEAWTAGSTVSTTTAAPIGTGGSGSTCNRMTYNGLSPSIAFRAAGTAFNSVTSGTNYTLNKPAGVVTSDLMLAFVTVNSAAGSTTCTPPAGWTLVDTVRGNAGGAANSSMFVLKRVAGGSEPASWTDGLLSAAFNRRTAIVVAYSGASDVSAYTSVGSGSSTPLYLTTPTLNNSDPSAWRISAFAVSDNATGGTMTANKLVPSAVPDISLVGVGTAWKYTNSGSALTIYRPSGVQSGDLMIAQVAVVGNGTVNVPSGWTKLREENAGSGAAAGTYCVMYRYAGGSEPSSWSGSISGSNMQTRISESVAYRNVHASTPFIDDDMRVVDNYSAWYSDYVTNTNSKAVRVSMFVGGHNANGTSFTSTETSERIDQSAVYSESSWFNTIYQTMSGAIYDSNGPVSTGDSRTHVSASRTCIFGGAWVGLLNPLTAPPSPVSDETARGVAAAGSSDPWLTARVFDSAGVVPVGSQSITGIWAPSSGSDKGSMTGWQGLIRPADAVIGGFGEATMATPVDISAMDQTLLDLAGKKVSVAASFIGTVGTTPYLKVHFYRANQLLSTSVEQGTPFNTSSWVKSSAVFDIPDGTTRMKVGVSAADLVVSDMVYWDRVLLALGDDVTFRPGTSRAAHPVWSRPLIEFADDRGSGYGVYANLPGTVAKTPSYRGSGGLAVYEDHTVIPLTSRKYRARTKSYGLAGDTFVSSVGPESADFRFVAENWWLKDIYDPENNAQLLVKREQISVKRTNTATVFQPLGEDLPVVLSEGFKGDSFTLSLIPVDAENWALLQLLCQSERTLFLQSDVDDAWWVRVVGDLNRGVLPTAQRRENPLREVQVTFVQVKPVD